MICFEKYLEYDNGRLIRKDTGDTAGWLSKEGYIYFKLFYKTYIAHRVIFYMHYGYMPNKVDHINGVRHDNRIENLRDATNAQNSMNRGCTKANKLGVKGVNFHKATGKYTAQSTFKGKKVYLGIYKTVEEAKSAYDNFIKMNHGEFANYG